MPALEVPKQPAAWFILEQHNEDGRPHLSSRELEMWGHVPIPIYDEVSIRDAYTNEYNGAEVEASVSLLYENITLAAGLSEGYYPANVVISISLPQSIGRLVRKLYSATE